MNSNPVPEEKNTKNDNILSPKRPVNTAGKREIDELPDWQSTADALPYMVMFMDTDFNIIAINKAALKFLNLKMENTIGRNYFEMMYGDAMPPEECPVAIYKKTGKPADAELLLPDKKIWVRVTTRPFLNKNKEVIALIHTIRDINTMKQAAEHMRIFHDFWHALNETSNIKEVLSMCLNLSIELSGMDSGGIYVIDRKTGDVKLIAHQGLSSRFIDKTSYYNADSPNAKLVMAGKPVYTDSDTINISLDGMLQREGLKCIAILPVKYQGRIIGCLNLASHKVDFITEDAHRAIESTLSHIRGSILRLLAEEAAIYSQESYRLLIQNANEAIIIAQDGVVKLANPTSLKLTGYTEEELLFKPFFNIIHPDDQQFAYKKYLDRMANPAKPEIFNIRLVTKKGTAKFIELNVVSTKWNDKHAAINLIRDITDIKDAEKRLTESEARYRLMADNIDDVIFTKPAGREGFTFISPSVERMLGYTQEEIMNKPLSEYLTPDSMRHALQLFSQWRQNNPKKNEFIRYEAEHIRKDGARIWAETITRPMFDDKDKLQGLTGVTRNITDRKLMEQALLDSEKQYRTLFENSPVPLWEQDFSEVKKYVDSLFKKGISDLKVYFKKRPDKFQYCIKKINTLNINQATLELIKCKDNEDFVLNIDRLLLKETYNTICDNIISFSRGIYSIHEKTKQRTMDGRIITIEIMINIMPGFEKDWSRILVSLIDITERQKAEEALKESERKFRNLFEKANEAITYMSISGEIIEANQATADLFGGTIEELKGKHFIDLGYFTGKDIAKYLSVFKNLLTGSKEPISVTITNRKGKQLFLETSAALIKSGNKTSGILLVTRDLTERQKLEEERQQNARLESIGTLAGGIAHDFNNLLTGIMGNIGLAKINHKPNEDIFQMLDEAEKASIRAKNLTQQLLTFARGGQPVKKPIDIGKILEEATGFALRGSNIKPKLDIPDNLWTIDADEGQIVQVITNLAINGHESMPEGGIINVGARNIIISKKDNLPLNNGKYIEITIADHGTGIKPEHLTRIFEPYFTTKQRGSGLGLATVYSIVKNHSGHITVESAPGKGSTFYVYLPVSEGISQPKIEETEMQYIPGTGKILIMDDNELIRELAPRMLEISGYTVDTATDGEEALNKYKEAMKLKKPFDAVIMDLTIPGGMGGREAIRQLKKIDRKAKVIVSSGYATDPIMANFRKYGFSAVVSKPYSATEMQRVLKDVLSKK